MAKFKIMPGCTARHSGIHVKIAIFLALLLSLSCKNKEAIFESFTGFTQGTTYSIVFQTTDKVSTAGLHNEVEKILHEFDMSLSLYKDSSILSKINRNEDVVPDKYFAEAFKKSVVISELTGGAFDITIGPLVKAWGFGPDEKKNFSDNKRDSLLQIIGMDKVRMENGRVVKDDPRVSLDLNAIAQGYSVDVLCTHFDESGIRNYLVEIGGEVRAKGTRNGVKWRIGIDRPEDSNYSPGENLEAIIRISDEALATSGNYRKFYVEDGMKYSHTIDPKTGYPARNTLLSATIIASDCATADGIATACMVMGKEKSVEFLRRNPQFLAFLIFSDDSGNFMTWWSPGLQDRITERENI